MIWAAYFLIVYASESIVCSRSGVALYYLTMALAATIVSAILIVLVYRHLTAQAEFLSRIGAGLALMGLVAVIWAALALAIIPACTNI